jgi:GNAT superfamily N-acetyltransferase
VVVTIAPAQAADVEAIAKLLDELDRFYGGDMSEPFEDQLAEINEALFSTTPAGSALLAWDGDMLVGLASYSFLWPAAGLTRSLYLKELYVAETHRRSGIGKRLMEALHDVARAHHCSRVEWTTDAPNLDAQRFYEELGVKPETSKIMYRSVL